MSYITIRGGRPLRGEITVQGAKNSVLPILAATLLAGDECRIEGCPHLSDVDSACDILRYLGCRARWDAGDLLVLLLLFMLFREKADEELLIALGLLLIL